MFGQAPGSQKEEQRSASRLPTYQLSQNAKMTDALYRMQ